MPSSQPPQLTDAQVEQLRRALEKRPVKFQIRTGSGKWACTVHPDRASYERFKTDRTNSLSSISSTTLITSTVGVGITPGVGISAVAQSSSGTSTPESK